MKVKITLVIIFIFGYIYSTETSFKTIQKDNTPKADTARIKKHLTLITKTDKSRNYKNLKTLNKIGAYIFDHFKTYADKRLWPKVKVCYTRHDGFLE